MDCRNHKRGSVSFSIEGYERWSRTIGIGEIRSLALSKDNRIVYVGESSPSGTLYALEVATGDILWKFDGVDVVGVENEIRAYPIPIHVETDKEGNVYAIFIVLLSVRIIQELI